MRVRFLQGVLGEKGKEIMDEDIIRRICVAFTEFLRTKIGDQEIYVDTLYACVDGDDINVEYNRVQHVDDRRDYVVSQYVLISVDEILKKMEDVALDIALNKTDKLGQKVSNTLFRLDKIKELEERIDDLEDKLTPML